MAIYHTCRCSYCGYDTLETKLDLMESWQDW